MSTPFTALLKVRRALERDAELAIAQARHSVTQLQSSLELLAGLRERWIESAVSGGPGFEGAGGQITAIHATEAAVKEALIQAQAALDEARSIWTQRNRDRRLAEEMEARALEELRQNRERREQATADDLAAILRLRAARDESITLTHPLLQDFKEPTP
ncbi:MAG: flagellar export protein FliJ [Candidatus Methylomirabilia bacterium]